VAVRLGQRLKTFLRCRQRVHPDRGKKELPVGAPLRRARAEEISEQQVHFRQQSLERTQPVPLGDGELDRVAPSGLSRAKRLDDLEDGTASRRQQALHGELRRGVQEAPGRGHRLQMAIGRGVGSEDRGLDFQVAPAGKKGPQPGDEPGALPQVPEGRRGAPLGTARAGQFFTRETYSPVRVSRRSVSSTSMNSGTRTTAPVSRVAFLDPPVAVSPRIPGSVSTTFRSTKCGG